jgi:hypothetical protein
MLKRMRPELPVGCVSDLRFDALHAGELAAAEARAIEAHIRSCQRCDARRRALAADHEAVSARLAPFAPSAQTGRSDANEPAAERRPARARARAAVWAGALAAAAALCLFMLPRDHGALGTRTKGGPSVGFYIKRGSEIHESLPGEPVAPKDVLRFVVTADGFQYLAILSRSEHGQTEVYFPEETWAAALDPHATRYPLPGAVELDDAVADERIHAVFCRAPFHVEPLREELARSGAIAARPGCQVTTLALHKQEAP